MRSLILIGLFASLICEAAPTITITSKDSYNGFATLSGKITGAGEEPLRISVKCGRTTYTTIPDSNGNWAIVFRHTDVNFSVHGWRLSNPNDPLWEKKLSLPVEDSKILEDDAASRG
jgi:hypothetical protein